MDSFIERVMKEKTMVNIITTNGFQMRGKIVENDLAYVVVNVGKVEKMVYKHAISTIEPA